ncbi:MAG: DUF2281 domain-containing protein [Nostoc sp.]|uniref:DUF2281 domain-containing protein n=1 Tax=Nostoc sp. TaxID=1180 RepID=UPI002FFC06C7
MAIDAEILQTLDQMPESLKQKLLHYAKYLVENYSSAEYLRKFTTEKASIWHLKRNFCFTFA